MKSVSASLVSVALLVAAASAQLQINTPNPPTQCIPVQITWSGGDPPYFLQIKPGGQPTAPALQQYAGLTGNSFTWETNITSGQSVGFTLTDKNGATAQSAPVDIQPGPDNSCLNGQSGGSSTTDGGSSATTSGGAAPTNTAPTGSGSTTGAATTGGSTGNSHSTTTGSSTSTTASPTGGSGNNGAFANIASMSVVGVLSAVAAALLA